LHRPGRQPLLHENSLELRGQADISVAFTYAELDEILRGDGHTGAIDMSAIDDCRSLT
jgi:hypothetical protein